MAINIWYGVWCVTESGGCGELLVDGDEKFRKCPECGRVSVISEGTRRFTIIFEDTEPYGKILRVRPDGWKHNTRVSVRGDQDNLTADLRYDGRQDWVIPLIKPIVTEVTHDL